MATLLFADVHGFTSLAEQLDFETASNLIKDIWSRLDSIIQDSVTKFSRDQEVIFKNSYLREVADGLIPKRSPGLYHRAASRWLSEHDDTAFKVMAAEHLEGAGDYFFASEQYQRAIDLATKRGAYAEAEAIRLRAQVAFDKTKKNPV